MGKILRFRPPGGDDDLDDAWMFAGLEGLAIVIEDLDPVAINAGLNRTNLQFQVEERLSTMGVPLAPLVAVTNNHAVAVLCVAFGADQHPTGFIACTLSLQVCEAAALARNPELGGGVVTWQLNDSWASSPGDVKQDVIEALDEGLGNLGSAFLTGRDA